MAGFRRLQTSEDMYYCLSGEKIFSAWALFQEVIGYELVLQPLKGHFTWDWLPAQ